MDGLKQKISDLLKESITYPIYVADLSDCKRRISKIWIEHNDIIITIDGRVDYLQLYSNYFQSNLYNTLKKHIKNQPWTD